MIYVRHLSSAGDVGTCWSYDAQHHEISVMLPHAAFALVVCSPLMPRFGAFPVMRMDACTWKLVPARYTALRRGGALITETWPLHENVGVETIALLDAPDRVSIELSELGRE
jgi:hypothetical protein